MRALKLASHFAAHRLNELHPFEIQASLINACNLKCIYCRCPEIASKTMDTAQWIQTIQGLAEYGAARIKFQGGEPTLRKDFRELTEVVQRSGVIASVTTNGQRMAEEPELFDFLDEVVFSLDAPDSETNDRHRGAGVHAKVVQSIEHAQKSGVRCYINMVVSRWNYAAIEQMLEFCEQHRIGFNAQPVQHDWLYADQEIDKLVLSEEDIRSMHHRMAEWKRSGRPLMFCAETYERSAVWEDYKVSKVLSEERSSCMAGRYYIHIEPNGDIYPCGFTSRIFQPKNILRDGLEVALRSAQHHHCQDCYMAYLNERKALFGLRPFAIRQMLKRR